MNGAIASAHVCTTAPVANPYAWGQPPRHAGLQVWHLVGPQGCGKTLFAQAAVEVIKSHQTAAVSLSAWDLEEEFSGEPWRIGRYLRSPLVVLLDTHLWEPGEHPRHWMKGDRLINLTDYAATRHRRPGLDRLLVTAMLEQPTRSVEQLRVEAKVQYEALHRSMLRLSAIATQRAGGAA